MTALIVALAVVIPTAALVLIAQQYFRYRSARTDADVAHDRAYREVVDQYTRLAQDIQAPLGELHQRVGVVEDLLRSVD